MPGLGLIGARLGRAGEGWRLRRRVDRWPVDHEGADGAGMRIPMEVGIRRASVRAGWGLCAFGGLVLLGCVAQVVIATFTPEEDLAYGLAMAPVGALFGVGLMLGGRFFLRRTLPDWYLLLSGDDVHVVYGSNHLVIPWSQLRGVRAHWTELMVRRGPLSRGRPLNWLTFDVDPAAGLRMPALAPYAGTTEPTVSADALTVDPYVVLAVIEHYRQHADARVELAEGRWQETLHRLSVTPSPDGG